VLALFYPQKKQSNQQALIDVRSIKQTKKLDFPNELENAAISEQLPLFAPSSIHTTSIVMKRESNGCED
jgi:hypothetical protein